MADGERGTENEQISDTDKMLKGISDMMADACAKLDSFGSRMDAVEERFSREDARRDSEEEERNEREDKARRDAEGGEGEAPVEERANGEIEEEGDPTEPTVDSRRRDARRDSEEEGREGEERGGEEGSAEMDAMIDQVAGMRARIAELEGRIPAALSASERERFAAIQEQAEPAFQAFGDRAPAPLQGETPTNYKRRLGTRMLQHSPRWNGSRLAAVSDETMLDAILTEVYSDSISAARRGTAVGPGELRAIEKRSPAGHTLIEFEGSPDAWMNSFAGHTMRATGKFLTQ